MNHPLGLQDLEVIEELARSIDCLRTDSTGVSLEVLTIQGRNQASRRLDEGPRTQ